MASKTPPKDGIYNSNGFAMAGFGPVFLAFVPVTSWLTTPGGLVERAVTGFVNGLSLAASAGARSSLPAAATVPALAAAYIAFTYGLTGAASVAGVIAGSEHGRSNKEPRRAEVGLRGLPLRLKSAHLNLVENFPGFGLAAALAVALAPQDRHVLNLLGLHVLAKMAVYYPAYLADVDSVRSLAHLVATSSVINVAWKIATNLS